MQKLTKTILVSSIALAVALSLAGCILPVPYIRQHIYATQGIVIDSDTGKSVVGAKIKVYAGRYMQETITDSSGHFAIEDENELAGMA